ncbi:MAG TPA: hypothetical protein RMG95_03855, partial [Polyangiaceae bacterium LLY-WYZ-15_(1-7)]|nr:hypothetical protein [Polyangiaceae bacterium LLY-WYZ-15_(1-7)]
MPSLAHGRSRTPARSGWALTVVASLGLHLGLALWIWQLPAPDALLPPELVWLDADVASAPLEDGPSGAVRRDADEARPGGARSAQNVDARSRGERGDGRGAMEVVLLTDRAHGVTLQDGPMNAPHVSQIQRIRTARDRASWENRRATPNPNDQPFLASGEGRHPERRPVSARDAAEGARRAPAPGRAGDPTDGPAGARGPDPLLPE